MNLRNDLPYLFGVASLNEREHHIEITITWHHNSPRPHYEDADRLLVLASLLRLKSAAGINRTGITPYYDCALRDID